MKDRKKIRRKVKALKNIYKIFVGLTTILIWIFIYLILKETIKVSDLEASIISIIGSASFPIIVISLLDWAKYNIKIQVEYLKETGIKSYLGKSVKTFTATSRQIKSYNPDKIIFKLENKGGKLIRNLHWDWSIWDGKTRIVTKNPISRKRLESYNSNEALEINDPKKYSIEIITEPSLEESKGYEIDINLWGDDEYIKNEVIDIILKLWENKYD